jgi:diguanylate cyclase (GGDEF)-like protein
MGVSQSDHDVRIERPWSLNERTGGVLLMLLVPAILVLDYTAGRDFSLHLFYLVPTGLAAWSFGSRAGYAVGLMAAAYWAFVGFATRQPYAAWSSLAWDVATTVALFLFFAFVVGRHRGFVDGLLESARLDTASGALSKREFSRLFETEVRRARRYRRPIALAVLDATTAKEFGRKGQEFLPAVVRAVQGHIRDSDSVARIADRRLAVILVECRSAEALMVVQRLQENIATIVRIDAGPPAIGLVSYAGGGPATAAELLQIAQSELAIAQGRTGISEQQVP